MAPSGRDPLGSSGTQTHKRQLGQTFKSRQQSLHTYNIPYMAIENSPRGDQYPFMEGKGIHELNLRLLIINGDD